jgi:Cu2+-containing amine oxidase
LNGKFVFEILSSSDSAVLTYNAPYYSEVWGIMNPTVANENPSVFAVPIIVNGVSGVATVIDKADVEQLTSGKKYLVLWAIVSYYDFFGKQHWVKHCNWKEYYPSGKYEARTCTAYNDAGDGPPPQ